MTSKKTDVSTHRNPEKLFGIRHSATLSLSLITLALSQSLMPGSASAATLEVNNGGDAGINCTLRDAVTALNSSGTALGDCSNSSLENFGTNDQIIFSVNTVTLTGVSLQPSRSLTISGNPSNVSISTTSSHGILDFLTPNNTITLENLTFENSDSTNSGGAISVRNGTLNMLNSRLINNSSTSGGGALSIVTTSASAGLASLNIVNSTLSGNQSFSSGGAIHSTGATTITISDSVISDNSTTSTVLSGVPGGGILLGTEGTLTLSNSTVSNNSATRGGGGLYGKTNTRATIENSTLSGNFAGSAGGGLAPGSQGIWTIKSSTISGNTASFGGAIFAYNSSVDIVNSTLSGNVASNRNSGVTARKYSQIVLRNTTVYGAPAGSNANDSVLLANGSTFNLYNSSISSPGGSLVPGCKVSTFGSQGGIVNADSNNIIVDDDCGTSALALDPKLAPLANNGGPTQTHALLAGSPAIDTGDNALCAAPPINGLDQRGKTRLQGVACDIGAYEFEPGTFFVIPIPGSNKATIFNL